VADMDRSQVIQMVLAGLRDFRGIDLSGVNLSGLPQLAKADFTGANLAHVDFSNSDLTGAQFQRTNLSGAAFRKSRLERAAFDGAQLTGVHFVGAYVAGASFRGAVMQDVTADGAEGMDRATFDKSWFPGSQKYGVAVKDAPILRPKKLDGVPQAGERQHSGPVSSVLKNF
jgi:uncharacterized protein YjbI with pentapeptide repeats